MQLKRSTTPGSTTNHAQPSYDGRWTCAYFRSVHVSPIDYDLGFLPLTIRNPVMYLLNYLDRGNIGNSKLLNSETGDSLIQQTKMTNLEYAIAVSLFAVAYALFEVPSNWIMKRYVHCCCLGAFSPSDSLACGTLRKSRFYDSLLECSRLDSSQVRNISYDAALQC
jgi:hypothetical protein